jgi:hypothetical protein
MENSQHQNTSRGSNRTYLPNVLARWQNPISEQFSTYIIQNIYSSKHHLPAKFTTIIATAINDWLQHREPLRSAPVPASVHPCIRSQFQIGWWQFLLGFPLNQLANILGLSLSPRETRQPVSNHGRYDPKRVDIFKRFLDKPSYSYTSQ